MPQKINLLSILILVSAFCSGQPDANIKIFANTQIWNSNESEPSFNIASIGYHQIPKYLEYKGVLVQALQWKDAGGDNLLLLTQTGTFPLNDTNKGQSASGAEIFAYLFHRTDLHNNYSLRWKIYDFIDCPASINMATYYPRSLTVTDLDHDKTAEIAVIYSMNCGNSDKPGEKKIIMHEADDKYEMKGQSLVCYQTAKGPDSIGGIYRADGKLIGQKVFYDFLKTKWKICDGGY
jgi:hypothetical protein